MANADKKHFGVGAQGKSSGTGGMTNIDKDVVGENEVMSNRDKARHPRERGLDSKATQVDQLNDNEANQSDGKI
jgi:hypothetical protein